MIGEKTDSMISFGSKKMSTNVRRRTTERIRSFIR